MKKKEMEVLIEEYKEILRDIGKWANPIQYKLNHMTNKEKLLFHIRGIKETLDRRFYKFHE